MITLLKILSFFLNLLPGLVLDLISRISSWFLYRILSFRRNIVEANLQLVFGDKKSREELRTLSYLNYQHYSRTLLEILKSITWSADTYRKQTRLEGFENIKQLIDQNKGGVFLGAHLGNWEFAVSTAALNGVPVDVVVKEAKSKLGQKFLDWYRKRFGVGIFLETKTVREIFGSINSGRFTVFILDQFMGPPIGVPVKFFGKEAGTAAGLALFCEKRDLPVFPAYNYRDSKGILCTVIEPQIVYGILSDDRDTRIFQRTQIYNDAMEKMIRQHPEQWLWIHRRWKKFKGKSRWAPVSGIICFSAVLLGLISCAGPKSSTPTGIELPPDPKITAPIVQPLDPGEDEEASSATIEAKQKIKPDVVAPRKRSQSAKPSLKPKEVENPHFHVIPSDKIPFEVGERVEMDLRWLAVPAGKAVMEVREGPILNGRPTYQLWGNVLSSKIVDAIYHVDNTAESFIDKEAFIPYKFLLHMVESKQNKETRVAFDHVNGKAFYWAKRLSERWGNLDQDRVDVLTPKAKDLWSAIYYARYLNYKLNEKQRFVVYENGQNWEVELTPVANELVTSRVGAFQCWKILVHVSLNNVLKPMGDVFMWLSDDSKKHLVKFDAKIKIGSLYGVLTSIKEH